MLLWHKDKCSQIKKPLLYIQSFLSKLLNLNIFKHLLCSRTGAEQKHTTDHLSKQLLRCVTKERNAANQKLVQDDSHGPPVHRLPVALPEDHFWGNVFRSPTDLEGNTQESNHLQIAKFKSYSVCICLSAWLIATGMTIFIRDWIFDTTPTSLHQQNSVPLMQN